MGKELVARAIHRNSLRKDEEFVQVNCAAIPEELIESELFGHEKGSFTGATEKQIGKFELAHKGTIFLDEVGDMSLRTQAKVLRVLQEGEVERIGSQKTIQVDVRVIAATNKKLEEAIEKGDFREDLYFRLSVIPIRVPPLRERAEDIPALVEHFVAQFSAENNFRRKTVSPEAMDVLKRHPWRGNVRELKNTVERLLIMVRGPDRPGAPRRRAAAPAGRRRRRPRRGPGLAQGLQGVGRARLPGPEAAREPLEHLGHRGRHRHPALEPLQEARAVRDQPGEGRLSVCRRKSLSVEALARTVGRPVLPLSPDSLPSQPREHQRERPRIILVDSLSTTEEAAMSTNADMKFEIVVIPVSDLDRAKKFYAGLGWRLDADFDDGKGFRVMQFTPPGSGCSVIFGKNVTAAAPGSAQGLYLIVSDIEAARKELLGRGVEVSETFHNAGVYAGPDEPYLFGRVRVSGPDPERGSYRSFASFRDPDGNGWLFQEVTKRLEGRIDPATTTFASVSDLASALRRAEHAHGAYETKLGKGRDENWPDWYAAYMVAEQSGAKLPE